MVRTKENDQQGKAWTTDPLWLHWFECFEPATTNRDELTDTATLYIIVATFLCPFRISPLLTRSLKVWANQPAPIFTQISPLLLQMLHNYPGPQAILQHRNQCPRPVTLMFVDLEFWEIGADPPERSSHARAVCLQGKQVIGRCRLHPQNSFM